VGHNQAQSAIGQARRGDSDCCLQDLGAVGAGVLIHPARLAASSRGVDRCNRMSHDGASPASSGPLSHRGGCEREFSCNFPVNLFAASPAHLAASHPVRPDRLAADCPLILASPSVAAPVEDPEIGTEPDLLESLRGESRYSAGTPHGGSRPIYPPQFGAGPNPKEASCFRPSSLSKKLVNRRAALSCFEPAMTPKP
jgi:hypothetical protein